jgi:hypothetical protein
MLYFTYFVLSFCMDFGIAETGIARGSPPGTTTEVQRVGFPSAEIRFVSAEALEEHLVKAQKHASAMQSKLDSAFAQYHNEVQDMQAKNDELVRKNKSLRNTNKGTPLPCRVLIDSALR